ncbi:hypothetical protein SAMN05216389_1403 [Oceanobacillus limi]|uniref:Uncharacterized protein n=1 Tax=Oceanobacillus limi TaxID=930131 RepID=A0A1I0HLS3_9BACI|nr:hypothetical protein [Oceanobacillus limi]SET84904.1 hypothetical protein SAMN05216389_1403 [Oceanobacillus limi]
MEYIREFQWLIGLIIGFLLNQFSVSIDRKRRKKDINQIFKKHILFIKSRLDYMSRELVKIPNTIYYKEDSKNVFIKNMEELYDYISSISKNEIPDKLINEVTEITGDFQFFINTMRNTEVGQPFYENDEFGDKLTFAEGYAKRQRENVIRLFQYLKIK